ncbi:mucin-17 isoform X1 [Anopheles stephensi]|uniref:mucin-17 isoform X1 n=2 Tax=Anopheles stephensi TaxID=30069 RepID=UPI00165872F2|nr:mucin-17 isoform X1 [Anopheles stephensi]XP_035897990.1 mucin-17 isoform X1 [Anopheles stephensi]XP_035897991.1 mucin-17 isoform X1 [Anopheles stephensi]XP_035897992.1 mucin-17 isoform X1 [Anopheles stephensi]XP_035897993.1 mucin-17 isoform X1 [Anopheles stephensi]XP_035897995.1 mucin-17 isoform X1 [Anopheles stephensi]XP_035897996.1 mucin-17 isoform X1 [Anopheles stephensi]XP_035897997.1 mucin-17 isoform X1 [Anopheles stephensi]XP_035897998.1 mucin-17 isoform X1 [Anopheles stephensi]XP
MTPMQQRYTCGSNYTDCPIKPCTSGHCSGGKRESAITTTSIPRNRTKTTTLTVSMIHKTMAPPTRTTMALCCWCLLLAVLVTTDALPITSKPLDNNPDHLTWEAAWLSEDSRAPMPLGGKSKKITPKSIFITPFLNSYNTSACPPDYKVDYNGKCIQVVSINTADILVTKLQSLFSQHGDGGSNGGTGEDDYDYDYDSTGPFHVNLPLSIDLPPEPPQPPKAQVSQTTQLTYKDIPGPSFYDSAMVDITTVDQDKAKITTVSVSDPEKPSSEKPFLATSTSSTSSEPAQVDQSNAESTHTDISFLAFETLPNGTLVGQVELEANNSTVVQSIFVSSTTTDVPVADGSSTAESTYTELASSTGTTTDRAADTAGTDGGDAVVSTVLSTQDVPTTTTKEEEDATITTDVSSTGAASTTEQDESDMEGMKLELEEELLLMDSNRSSLAPLDASTTDISEMDLDTLPTAETLPSDEPTVVNKVPESVAVSTTTTTVPPPVRPLMPIPTKPSVQIITPIKGSWDLGFRGSAHLLPASHLIQQDRTTRATPETTTQAINVERSTQPPTVLNVRQDSPEDKKNSEEVDRHEAQHALREANEASNRFVYHHLPAATFVSTTAASVSSSESPETTTTSSILQVQPLASTPAGSNNNNYLDQLRKINEIVAEKRRHQQQQEQQLGVSSSSTRIRFPSRDEEQLSVAASNNYQQQQQQANGVRFPGTSTNRLTPVSSNRLPDIFPKKTPDSTTQRPAFWWLPSGWEVDQTGNKPMLLRFWSRMPLVRDSSLQPSTTGSANNEPADNTSGTNNNRWRSATGFQQQQQQSQQTTGTSHPVATARGNSKSPSENFYKEVSAQEVYKVMNARQLNQHHQR